jgi:hypothetical protein
MIKRDESRQSLLNRWKAEWRTKPESTEILTRIYTSSMWSIRPKWIKPRSVGDEIVRLLAREQHINLPELCHPRVIYGKGDLSRYESGDFVYLFPATSGSIALICNPRATAEPARGPKPVASKGAGPSTPSRPQRD